MNKRLLTFIVLAVAAVAVVSLSIRTRISTSDRSALATPWASPTCGASGPTSTIHLCSARRMTLAVSFSPTRRSLSLTSNARRCWAVRTRDKNAEGKGTEQDVAGVVQCGL